MRKRSRGTVRPKNTRVWLRSHPAAAAAVLFLPTQTDALAEAHSPGEHSAPCTASTNQRAEKDGVIAYVIFYAPWALSLSVADMVRRMRQTHAA